MYLVVVPACHRKHELAQALRAGLNGQMYYTYVLRSLKDNKLYVGFSKDLKVRVKEHKIGKVPATKSRLPLKLVYYEACLDEKKAVKREKYLKSGFGRNFLKGRI